MTTDGWEQRLADLGQARELREEIARTLAEDKGILWNSLSEKIGTCDFFRAQADALLSGPLAPLLAALSTKGHNHTRFTNDSGVTWSSCPQFCPVAIRAALQGEEGQR